MISPGRIGRFIKIEHVLVKYGLEELALGNSRYQWLKVLFLLSPTRWRNTSNRKRPRGERIRLALEELGPIFVKLGQVLSTRRDLLPDDIGLELTKLQDDVPPFSGQIAKLEIERALGAEIHTFFDYFESTPLASASIAQVHCAKLKSGKEVIIKVLRPNIEKVIDRDISLMYLLADLVSMVWGDAKRLKPKEVVQEYDHTIHDELDLVREAANAVTLRRNFKDSPLLYIPEIYWDLTRKSVLVMERIYGISIRDIDAMKRIKMDMKKLAENGVEIFYTQVFKHNFFHADMHPGNIFVFSEKPAAPRYIAVDFGIVGSLTEQDQRYLGENMLAFFRRDYRRVAQLHIDSGWVPSTTRVQEFEMAIRSVCEPIFDKPLSEISFGVVLLQLFQTARRFNMEVQPQLVLLQKTLLNIEGLGRQLYPQLDLWTTAKPFLEQWVLERRSPAALLRRLIEQVPEVLEQLPQMPMLLHDLVEAQTLSAEINNSAGKSSSKPDVTKPLKRILVGATVLIVAVLVGGVNHIGSQGTAEVPAVVWVAGFAASILLLSGLFS